MSASVNRVILVGRLGQDPEVRQFDNGNKVANLSIATSERWTDKQTGEPKEHTEWHRVSLYNRLAEIAGQYLRKGSLVYIEGSLHTRKYTDQQGIERYATEVKAQSMQMLGGGQNQQQGNQGYPQQGQGGYNQPQGQWQQPPQGGQAPNTAYNRTAPQGNQWGNQPQPPQNGFTDGIPNEFAQTGQPPAFQEQNMGKW